MSGLCEKVLLHLDEATEDDPRSDARRLRDALADAGVVPVQPGLSVLKQLYPACREGAVTATLLHVDYGTHVTRLEAGDTTAACYGLACDYGSTTIIMELVNTATGKTVAHESVANGQIQYGTDILTRITYGLGGEKCRADIQRATVASFNELVGLVERTSGVPRSEYAALVISGNTTMQHFLMGLDAWTVFSAPYKPVTLNPGFIPASELGIDLGCQAFFMPGASNYVGGDIMSGLLNLDFWRGDETCAFFDVGTNGELVVGNGEWLMGGAGAAGPALEGYISEFGMRAQPGAIDTVSIEGEELSFTTIDDEPARGICGSGIIDLIAEMRLNGWVGIDGTLNPQAGPAIRMVGEGEEAQLAVVYASAHGSASGEDLVFTQTDIFQYLQTKAAAHTMMDCTMDATGITVADLDRIYLTGAFCAHANLESAITIGMFPDLPRERFALLPNASLSGAVELLLDASKLDVLSELVERIYCVQFANMPDFSLRMRAAKFIPHTNMEDYPSVAEALAERGL